jgi:hypothetical protein
LGEGGGTSNKSRNEPLGSKTKTLKMPKKKKKKIISLDFLSNNISQ